MDVVTVKFREDVLKKIDRNIKEHNFNSRTEFIREAVRDKLSRLTKDELVEGFLKYKGKAKKKTTREENLKTKDETSRELLKELEKRFS